MQSVGELRGHMFRLATCIVLLSTACAAFAAEPQSTQKSPVRVLGVFEAGDPAQSSVIISQDGTSAIYRIGDMLPDGRKIVEISKLHVLLSDGLTTQKILLVGSAQGIPRQLPSRADLERFAEEIKRKNGKATR